MKKIWFKSKTSDLDKKNPIFLISKKIMIFINPDFTLKFYFYLTMTKNDFFLLTYKYLLIMDLRFDTMLYSYLCNENSIAGHIKCSRGPHVRHPWLKS